MAMGCAPVAPAPDLASLPRMLEINFRIPKPPGDMHTIYKWRTG
jgi:hypothetical protein